MQGEIGVCEDPSVVHTREEVPSLDIELWHRVAYAPVSSFQLKADQHQQQVWVIDAMDILVEIHHR